MPEPEAPPRRLTPATLRRLEDLCARRLARDVAGEPGVGSPVNQGRVRDALLEAAHVAHLELRAPDLGHFPAPPGLLPEERALFAHAARWYVQLFGDRPARAHLHELRRPTPSRTGRPSLGGWVDLTVEDAGGRRELRQLDLWGARPLPDDPTAAEDVRLALLRLYDWASGAGPVRVVVADLLHGDLRTAEVDLPARLPELQAWLDDRLAVLDARTTAPTPSPGSDCGTCRHVARCPAHPGAARGPRPRDDLRPEILPLTPTALEQFATCGRAWRARHLLRLPPSDGAASPDHGLLVHAVLGAIHRQGRCDDESTVHDVLAGHGLDRDTVVAAHVAAHRRRCPSGATGLGHEHEVARFHRTPLPLFVATARLDAVWVHDGILDVRDYKTGVAHHERVADDPRARLQAWAAAPLAAARGLRVRIRYEHLAPEVLEDPEPFEPDDDDMAAIEEELRAVAARMWSADAFTGVADPAVCGRCRYRSVCPDSVTPGEPIWPAPPG